MKNLAAVAASDQQIHKMPPDIWNVFALSCRTRLAHIYSWLIKDINQHRNTQHNSEVDHLFFPTQWCSHGDYSRSIVTLTTTVHVWQDNRTEAALVLWIQWCTHEELFKLRLTKLTNMQSRPLVLCIECLTFSHQNNLIVCLSFIHCCFMEAMSKKCIQTTRDFEVSPKTTLVLDLSSLFLFLPETHNRSRPSSRKCCSFIY